MPPEPTVFIVDDDPALADALTELVQSMGLSARWFASGRAFLEAYDRTLPGCLILDLRLPDLNGLEILDQLVAQGNHVPVIMVTAHGDVASGVRAIKTGALDFLEKPFSPQRLRTTILHALQVDTQRRDATARRAELEQRRASLTADEARVAELISLGHTNKEIATALDLSVRTVQFRRASIMSKLGTKSRADLVRLIIGGGP